MFENGEAILKHLVYIYEVSRGGRGNHYTRSALGEPRLGFVSIKSFCSRISDKLIFIKSLPRDYSGEVNVFLDKSLFDRIHKILFFALKKRNKNVLKFGANE